MSVAFRRWSAIPMTLALFLLATGCSTSLERPAPEVASRQECVVLLHGLWRSNLAMRPIEAVLLQNGYTVVNLDYPSTAMTLEDLAVQHLAPAVALCEGNVSGPVHLVSHSMGGIVIRQYLQNRAPQRPGRIVMLSPPNQGSELAVTFRDWPLFDWFAGAAAASLSRDERGVLDDLQPVPMETGIIAGDSHRQWFDFGLVEAPHDGTVTVNSMPLPEMKGFVVVHENHVSIRRSPEVHQHILHFLQHGRFANTTANAASPARAVEQARL